MYSPKNPAAPKNTPEKEVKLEILKLADDFTKTLKKDKLTPEESGMFLKARLELFKEVPSITHDVSYEKLTKTEKNAYKDLFIGVPIPKASSVTRMTYADDEQESKKEKVEIEDEDLQFKLEI